MQNITERLRAVREDLSFSQKEMAVFVGAKFRTWQDYERGLGLPKVPYLIPLVEKGYDINWILTGAGTMHSGTVNGTIFEDSLFKDTCEWFMTWAQKNSKRIGLKFYQRIFLIRLASAMTLF